MMPKPTAKTQVILDHYDQTKSAALTARHFARHFGRNYMAVYTLIRKHRPDFRSDATARHEAELAQLRDLVDRGKSAAEIATALNRSRAWITNHAGNLGLKPVRKRTEHRKCNFRTTKAATVFAFLFHRPDISDADAGRELSCTREYVGQIRSWMREKQIVKTY